MLRYWAFRGIRAIQYIVLKGITAEVPGKEDSADDTAVSTSSGTFFVLFFGFCCFMGSTVDYGPHGAIDNLRSHHRTAVVSCIYFQTHRLLMKKPQRLHFHLAKITRI